eukprot:2548917-Alexandrium_andersonii.AAC.1
MLPLSVVSGEGRSSWGEGYKLLCPLGCGHVNALPARPVKIGQSWPKMQCMGCFRKARIGASLCFLCEEPVRSCRCEQTREPHAQSQPRKRQATLH